MLIRVNYGRLCSK